MPKYIIRYLFENIVKAENADEAKQFLRDDVIDAEKIAEDDNNKEE